jgi:hypothetical protein
MSSDTRGGYISSVWLGLVGVWGGGGGGGGGDGNQNRKLLTKINFKNFEEGYRHYNRKPGCSICLKAQRHTSVQSQRPYTYLLQMVGSPRGGWVASPDHLRNYHLIPTQQ